jgi:hypothetical protein
MQQGNRSHSPPRVQCCLNLWQNSSCLCRHILDNAQVAGIDEEARITVEYTMLSGVRPAKSNQLVPTIDPPSSFAGKIFYFKISAKLGETLCCRLLRLSLRDP